MDYLLTEISTYIPILILIITISILSNREIRKSLEQSRIVQDILSRDRDALSIELKASNEKLDISRQERISELAKAAEFGRLSQGLFHDLMTPLTSIILHTEKLNSGIQIQKGLEKALEASKRMAIYAQDIKRNLSKEEIEKSFDLGEELEGVLHLFSYKIRAEKINIKILKDGTCIWYGNPIKIRQIFSNLISNAIDSFENMKQDRENIVEISLIKKEKDNIIIIKDNGSGMNTKILESIFDPFFTTKSPEKGTGIGLATVKFIVEKNLQGNIKVESEYEKGSTFTITFPS